MEEREGESLTFLAPTCKARGEGPSDRTQETRNLEQKQAVGPGEGAGALAGPKQGGGGRASPTTSQHFLFQGARVWEQASMGPTLGQTYQACVEVLLCWNYWRLRLSWQKQ